jgi:hypothetical protein
MSAKQEVHDKETVYFVPLKDAKNNAIGDTIKRKRSFMKR